MPRDAPPFTVSGLPGLNIDLEPWAEKEIPKREWIARGYLLRRSLTLIAGSAGASKSSLIVAWSSALALGRPFNRFRPARPMRLSIYNVEDDQDEQRRRFSAILRQFNSTPADVARNIARVAPEGVGTLLDFAQETGAIRETPAMTALIEHVDDFKPDVLILDPLAELHSAPENDNIALRAVMAHLRALAARSNLSVLLVHHTRKGLQVAGDPDAARGASSIIGAARIALTVTTMQEPEATAFGLKAEDRRHYFRVDGSKSNYAPLTDAEWFQRISIDLDNGDDVGLPEPWSPPVDVITMDTRSAIEAGITAGSPTGPWSPKLSNDARSVRNLLLRHGLKTTDGQRRMLLDLRAGGYVVALFRRANRAEAQGIRSPQGLPSNVVWIDDKGAE